MTAALLLSIELARKLNGDCAPVAGGVLANDGSKHADCSTCTAAACGKSRDMGLAEAGFRITRSWQGLSLAWRCPGCGGEVTEQTELFAASRDARTIAADPLCGRCRR